MLHESVGVTWSGYTLLYSYMPVHVRKWSRNACSLQQKLANIYYEKKEEKEGEDEWEERLYYFRIHEAKGNRDRNAWVEKISWSTTVQKVPLTCTTKKIYVLFLPMKNEFKKKDFISQTFASKKDFSLQCIIRRSITYVVYVRVALVALNSVGSSDIN